MNYALQYRSDMQIQVNFAQNVEVVEIGVKNGLKYWKIISSTRHCTDFLMIKLL